MQNILTEIKQLAQKGMENTIISNDTENKELFLNILLKSEVAINQLNPVNFEKKIIQTKEETSRTYKRIDEDLKSDMYLVAYCFSNFEHASLYPQYSQDKAFMIAADKIGVKKNTLKNSRDWFDGHNNSHRNGWWQQPLPEDMQKFKDIYDTKEKEDVINEAKAILDIKNNEKEKNMDFGQNLKGKKYYGKFRSKKEVEEFIQTVLNESPTVIKDLLTQCSQKSFEACFEYFSNNYNNSTDELAKQILIYDPRTASNSDFSLWIRARFIQEIFKQGLEKEALNIIDK